MTTAESVDIEASGLLDGLEGDARAERAELIEWLLQEGFSVERIKDEVAPMLLPAGRVVGDDGVRVSARQICAETGIDLELLEAIQRALGLPRSEDPDAAILATRGQRGRGAGKGFHRSGFSREQVITVSRVLGQGLAQTAEVMRQVALEAVLQPGATELQIAQAYGVLVQQVSPLLGPLCEDVLLMQLRHRLETEAVSAAERAAGVLPGARGVAVAFADLVGFTRLGEEVPPEALESLANRLSELGPRRRLPTSAIYQDDRRRRDVRQHRPGGIAAGCAGSRRRSGEVRRLSPAARRTRQRLGGQPRG